MEVTRGKTQAENIEKKIKKEADEEKRLTEMMIPKKHKRLYSKIMYSQKKKKQEVIIFLSIFNHQLLLYNGFYL